MINLEDTKIWKSEIIQIDNDDYVTGSDSDK